MASVVAQWRRLLLFFAQLYTDRFLSQSPKLNLRMLTGTNATRWRSNRSDTKVSILILLVPCTVTLTALPQPNWRFLTVLQDNTDGFNSVEDSSLVANTALHFLQGSFNVAADLSELACTGKGQPRQLTFASGTIPHAASGVARAPLRLNVKPTGLKRLKVREARQASRVVRRNEKVEGRKWALCIRAPLQIWAWAGGMRPRELESCELLAVTYLRMQYTCELPTVGNHLKQSMC